MSETSKPKAKIDTEALKKSKAQKSKAISNNEIVKK